MNAPYGDLVELKGRYPWANRKKVAYGLGVKPREFWGMTPIDFWDYYRAYWDQNSGGPPPEKMTVEKGERLRKEVERRLAKKATG